jgi:opacity protein-like surface antigen
MIKNIGWKLALVVALLPASAFAQAPLSTASGPSITASIGYSYVNIPIASSRIDMNGLGASVTADFRSRFGAKLDLNYVRQSNLFGTGHHGDLLSGMLGPMYYPVSNDRLAIYVQVLAGDSRATGVIPTPSGKFTTAYTDGLCWAVGAGLERSISSNFMVRTETDYMRTSFIASSGAFQGQNDLRITGSIVYRWHWHSEGRHDHKHF